MALMALMALMPEESRMSYCSVRHPALLYIMLMKFKIQESLVLF